MPPSKGSRSTGGGAGSKMSGSDASRVQSTQAKSGGETGKNSFPARAQSAAAKNGTPASGPKAGKGGKA
ncbi:uncharacterized protein C8Q71DRAFT_854954 [Rhodofomes roseus]|uniref:SMP domain-containing protein n=1 Tax=Rhodofomes roseus TaxID=34475 RepID=A0ABQ8KR43_9APHY|nr:uncharacterized protein C8Q71DRAFT_854954 [Rhodofomes roseus]KAH9841101.1 hypothetical protein C8Q71DRAFT_854954 [Rhodofomes roseus]